ncbi:universal stress protein [Sulfurimonas sp.]|uniref:universal stress protein n=1 Tax=Sulfurimonas sp. TaxID=2022749 RepID=UPI0025D341E8|nr:universal stress protein [Sulfurimonas sp.]MCK9472838.1 universal stress protein [Sulfurimonas sp.]MDD3505350.1 universal stress protein [Sulfurimonas sp.]
MQYIKNMQKAVFACIDGSKYSEAVCDYALHIAKELNLTLVLLNTIEHPSSSFAANLSGNISLGERDDLLHELSSEDALKNRQTINHSKEVLKKLKQRVQESGFKNITVIQRHGTLYENLKELEDKLRVVIFGISGTDHMNDSTQIGSHVENIIRDVDAPIILVNKEYTPIKNVMIAFNGESGSIRALEEVSSSPMLGRNITRYLLNSNNDKSRSNALIKQAREIVKESELRCEFIQKSGDALEDILESIDKNSIDILAIGSYSHGKLRSALFGSFTTKLMQNVKIPLIILK